MALSTLRELSSEMPFLDILSEDVLFADKLTTLTLQARDHFGHDIALKTALKQVFMISKTQSDIDVTNERIQSKKEG